MKLLQRLASLHGAKLRLCPVFFNGKLILGGPAPEDAVRHLDALLAYVQQTALVPET